MAPSRAFPLVPKTNSSLEVGDLWSIPLSEGRFACARVLSIDATKRMSFVAGIVDWLGSAPPTAGAVAGARVLESGSCHVRSIAKTGGAIVAHRPLEADGIKSPPHITSYWGMTYVTSRAERLLVRKDEPESLEIRQISSPLRDELLKPITARDGVVQFTQIPSPQDLIRISNWLAKYPHATLRAYGSVPDLEFLRYFPFLKRFSVGPVYSALTSFEGLRHLPDDLEQLGLGMTLKRHDLAVIGRFQNLKTLYLEGHTKGIEVVSRLRSLEELTLRSITLPDLTLLLPLENLLALDIKLGGTKNLELLPEVGRLRYLELWLVRGLSDISMVGRLPHLRYLFLQALKQVNRLPDMSGLTELRRVVLETMKGITDLKPLSGAPNLEQLLLIDMPQLKPEDLECLRGHPKLSGVTAGLGSLKKNEAVEVLLGLPRATQLKRGWREV